MSKCSNFVCHMCSKYHKFWNMLRGGRVYIPRTRSIDRSNFYKLLGEIEYKFLHHLKKYLVKIEDRARLRKKWLVEGKTSNSIIISILQSFDSPTALSTSTSQPCKMRNLEKNCPTLLFCSLWLEHRAWIVQRFKGILTRDFRFFSWISNDNRRIFYRR